MYPVKQSLRRALLLLLATPALAMVGCDAERLLARPGLHASSLLVLALADTLAPMAGVPDNARIRLTQGSRLVHESVHGVTGGQDTIRLEVDASDVQETLDLLVELRAGSEALSRGRAQTSLTRGHVTSIAIDTRPIIALYVDDFENDVSGVWSDSLRSTTPSGRVFLGDFGNDTVSVTVSGLPAHDSIRIALDLFVLRSMDGNETQYGLDLFRFEAPGMMSFSTTFSAFGVQAYPGAYPGAVNPAGSGAAEINTLGYTFDDTPMDAVYPISFVLRHSAATLDFIIAVTGLEDYELDGVHHANESWGIDNFRVVLDP